MIGILVLKWLGVASYVLKDFSSVRKQLYPITIQQLSNLDFRFWYDFSKLMYTFRKKLNPTKANVCNWYYRNRELIFKIKFDTLFFLIRFRALHNLHTNHKNRVAALFAATLFLWLILAILEKKKRKEKENLFKLIQFQIYFMWAKLIWNIFVLNHRSWAF